jgi:hypothetical protein
VDTFTHAWVEVTVTLGHFDLRQNALRNPRARYFDLRQNALRNPRARHFDLRQNALRNPRARVQFPGMLSPETRQMRARPKSSVKVKDGCQWVAQWE